jgi:hypothetical protein
LLRVLQKKDIRYMSLPLKQFVKSGGIGKIAKDTTLPTWTTKDTTLQIWASQDASQLI